MSESVAGCRRDARPADVKRADLEVRAPRPVESQAADGSGTCTRLTRFAVEQYCGGKDGSSLSDSCTRARHQRAFRRRSTPHDAEPPPAAAEICARRARYFSTTTSCTFARSSASRLAVPAAALCSGVGGDSFAAAPALASASAVAYRCGTARIALTSPSPNAAAKMSRK